MIKNTILTTMDVKEAMGKFDTLFKKRFEYSPADRNIKECADILEGTIRKYLILADDNHLPDFYSCDEFIRLGSRSSLWSITNYTTGAFKLSVKGTLILDENKIYINTKWSGWMALFVKLLAGMDMDDLEEKLRIAEGEHANWLITLENINKEKENTLKMDNELQSTIKVEIFDNL
jgi:hypothetical protein